MLNIAVEESRLFLTKERAPFMICVEIFRPEELKLDLQEEQHTPHLEIKKFESK